MPLPKQILLTTTPNIEGCRITNYLGPISAQLVIGTGLITDFLSGLTDFFGLHSGAYQGKLNQINEKALSLIREKAAAIGANAVVGLRVDHDEISGGGKSMLMVTAFGTAVMREELKTGGLNLGANPRVITANDLNLCMKRREVSAEAAENRLNESDETWQFLIENQVSEVAIYVLRKISDLSVSEQTLTRACQYFSALPSDVSKPLIYEALVTDLRQHSFALDLIKQNRLFDTARLRDLLKRSDLNVKQLALQAIDADQPYYMKETMSELEELKADIEASFSSAPVIIKEKGFLSSSKEVWECSCGRYVELYHSCSHCGTDMYGFTPDLINPEAAIKIIDRKLAGLREFFSPLSAAR